MFLYEVKKIVIKNPISFSLNKKDNIFFNRSYRICEKESLNVSRDRFLSLYHSMKYIYSNNIKGDLVECGVFKGGSSMMIGYCMKKFQKSNSNKKKLWMYDTFEGMTDPEDYDINILNQKAKMTLNHIKKIKNKNDMWAYSPLDTVRTNIKKTKLNQTQYCFVQGPVETTLKKLKPKKIALLRLDTDFYSSTKAELDNLYELVEKNGIIIIDDYGHWRGCKKAVDNFFKDKKNFFFNYIDYSAIIGIKLE